MDLIKLITEQNESEEDVSKEIMELFETGTASDKTIAFNSSLSKVAKELLNKHSLARKVLYPAVVRPGQVVRFDRDQKTKSYVIGEQPGAVEYISKGKYVYPPEAEISIQMFLPKVINGKNLHEAFMNMVSELITQEDNYVVSLLRKAALESNIVTHYPVSDLKVFMQFIQNQFDDNYMPIGSAIIERTFTELYNNGFKSEEGSFFGKMGTMDRRNERFPIYSTSELSKCDLLKPGEILVTAQAESFGGMPIRIDLMAEGWMETNELKSSNDLFQVVSAVGNPLIAKQENLMHPLKGWFVYELVSMVIPNGKFVLLVV